MKVIRDKENQAVVLISQTHEEKSFILAHLRNDIKATFEYDREAIKVTLKGVEEPAEPETEPEEKPESQPETQKAATRKATPRKAD